MNHNEHPFWALGYVLIFLAIQVMAQTAAFAATYIINGGQPEPPTAIVTIVAMALFSLATIALFTRAGWAPVSRSYVVSRPWVVVAWSVVAALGALLPSLYVQELLPQWPEALQRYADQTEAEAMRLMSERGGYALLCLLAPVAEELVFRGAVLRTLLGWRPQRRWAMIALSALLFALAHLNPAQLLHPFAAGLLLGWMYERTRSVVPGIIFHWANNTAAYLLWHAYPAADITLADIFGSSAHATMGVLFSLLILLPAIYQLHLNMRRA